jgi:cytidine deaminase
MPTPLEQHPELIDLAAAAVAAAQGSYSPYSGFKVGCALRTPSGEVVRGANIESASYGLSQCAERTALFAAAAAGQRGIPALAVSCPGVEAADAAARPGTVMPCGACRQVMSELMAPDGMVVVVNVGVFTMEELLPYAFQLG